MAIHFEVNNVYRTPERFLLLVREVTAQKVTFTYLGSAGETLRAHQESDRDTVALSTAPRTADNQKWKLVACTRVSWAA